MLAYVALQWDESETEARQAARRMAGAFINRSPGWEVAVDTPGLTVFYMATGNVAPDTVYRLHGNSGAILGRLFEADYEANTKPQAITFDVTRTREVLSTDCRALLRKYWGRYVAFVADPTRSTSWVLRDPSGAVPCYMMSTNNVDVYFLRLEDCERLAPLELSVSRRAISGRLTLVVPCDRLTALSEISVLLAGECVIRGRGRRLQAFYWNPVEVSQNDIVEDAELAEKLTRKTVRACVHAWASCFTDIRQWLSGGIDSSIVLSCLKDAPNRPSVICEIYYGREGSELDERKYARSMAQAVGYDLVESAYKADSHFQIPRSLPITTEPYYFGQSETMPSGARPPGSGWENHAVFTGCGGDELFFWGGRLPTAADLLYRRGSWRNFLATAVDDSIVDGVALWRIVWLSMLYGLLRRPWNVNDDYIRRVRKSKMLVDPAIPPDVRDSVLQDALLMHPLHMSHTPGVPPGKINQAFLMSLAADKRYSPPINGYDSIPVQIDPLQSQPLIELSLRIPLYVLRAGGRDRAVARRAFASDLPAQILHRRTKGGADEGLQSALIRNIRAVRECLLDGFLVKDRYLERATLEKTLRLNAPSQIATSAVHIRHQFAIEVWYSTWIGNRKAAGSQPIRACSHNDRLAAKLA